MDATAASHVRPPWEDPGVRSGMDRLLAARRALLGRGERPLGWEIAFGPAAVREPFGPSGPVVGFLDEATGAAIEPADVYRPPSELEEVIAADIYHRRVLLASEPVAGALPVGPIAVAVTRDGEPLTATEDAEAATGGLAELVAYLARYLHAFGAELQPGEVIISGSTVPLIEVPPGQAIRCEVAGAGAVDVRRI